MVQEEAAGAFNNTVVLVVLSTWLLIWYVFLRQRKKSSVDPESLNQVDLTQNRCGLAQKHRETKRIEVAIFEGDALDQQRFAECVLGNQPVLLRGGLKQQNWTAAADWTPTTVKAKVGNRSVAPKIDMAPTGGKISMRKMIDTCEEQAAKDSPSKTFTARCAVHSELAELKKDLKKNPPLQFALGPLAAGPVLDIGHQGEASPLVYDNAERLFFMVSGTNTFRLFPPSASQYLYPARSRGWTASQVDLQKADIAQFPLLRKAMDDFAVTVEVQPGDMLYIPICWWHQVEGGKSTNMSLSYWFDSPCLKKNAEIQREQYEEDARLTFLQVTSPEGASEITHSAKCKDHGRLLMVCKPCSKKMNENLCEKFPPSYAQLCAAYEENMQYQDSLLSKIKKQGTVHCLPEVKMLLDSADTAFRFGQFVTQHSPATYGNLKADTSMLRLDEIIGAIIDLAEGFLSPEAVAGAQPVPVVVCYQDKGLLANVLQLLDTLLLVAPAASASPPRAQVHVDWKPLGHEGQFTYGNTAQNVFPRLFSLRGLGVRQGKGKEQTQAAGEQSAETSIIATNDDDGVPRSKAGATGAVSCTPWDHASKGSTKFYAPGTVLCTHSLNALNCSVFRGVPFPPEQRAVYHQLWHRHVQVDARILAMVKQVSKQHFSTGARKIAVHVRVYTPATAAGQVTATLPTMDQYLAAAAAELNATGEPAVMYLATDSIDAVAAFTCAFGEQLVVREVRRTAGGIKNGASNEVHRQPGCGEQDAMDVMCDVMCMAMCDVLVHADSNVSKTVSIVNKDMKLVHV